MTDPLVFIVDDDEDLRDAVLDTLEDTGLSAAGFASANAALEQLDPNWAGVVVSDIRMPGIDGLEVAEKLAELEHPPAIIFCTAYDEYAIKAFKYKAIGYLLKPARKEDLDQALSQAKQLNQLQVKQLRAESANEDSKFVAHSWQGHELIDFSSIYYFRSDQKYLTIVHEEGETLSDQTLKELEKIYPETLLRVHRNTLVNTQHIGSLSKDNEAAYIPFIIIVNS